MTDQEDRASEFIAMETKLTVFELLLLFKIATNDQGLSLFEPIWTIAETLPITSAPFLPEESLRQMALQQRLVRLGLAEMYLHETEGHRLRLTPKGMEAVHWWVGTLEDMGFSHEVLAGD